MLFGLLDVAVGISHIDYQKVGQSDLTLLDFQAIIANSLIRKYLKRQKALPQRRPGKRRSLEQAGPTGVTNNHPEFQVTRKRCNYCRNEG